MSTIFIDAMNQLIKKNMWSEFYNVFFNTGNLVFSEYCKKEVAYCSVNKLNEDWANVDRNSVYVLSLSNNLSVEDTYFTRLLYRLAKYKLNVVPIGLGVQTNLNESPREYVKKIPGRKKRLFQQLAYNTSTIGVRGGYTAECLQLMGIHNVRVIGCPSFYSNLIEKSSCRKEIEYKFPVRKICANQDLNLKEEIELIKDDSTSVENVIQTMPEWGECQHTGNMEGKHIFFSIEDWCKWIKSNEFSGAIGNRFHGNMICYLNGVQTIWIERDRRTAELIETLGLPSIRNGERIYELDKVFEEHIYTKEFYGKRTMMRENYIDFLNENGIQHKFDMEQR